VMSDVTPGSGRCSQLPDPTEPNITPVRRRWRIKFAWYDMWVGAFYDRHRSVLYVCPLPMLLIEWRLRDG
jgi:hypothetical protein